MDAVWLILDSLSASETPFVPDGPDTMPQLEALAKDHAKTHSQAYVPGPASPSSHASFFTGKSPSETGMTEASPFFDRPDVETIAGALEDTHRSFLISTNPFIFNGLQRDFDVVDDLRNEQYLLFESGSDPGRVDAGLGEGSTLRRYLSFVRRDGKPIRSLLNGIYYKLWTRRQGAGIPKHVGEDDPDYQYASEMNERIERFLGENDPAFVCANYMDVHPPFDASDAAIDAAAEDFDREDLPIGVRGRDVYDEIQAGNTTVGERMRVLYRAAIWDLDRKLAPLVERLLSRDTSVIVTADHGTWFDRSRELDEERIHVPLLLFTPDREPETVDFSVNLRSLPATTMQVLTGDTGPFAGPSLIDVEEDQVSLTEFIHDDSWGHGPVTPGGSEGDIRRDVAAVKNDARVDLIDEDISVVRGPDAEVDELRGVLEEVREQPVYSTGGAGVEYDDETERRLRELGYLE